VLGLRPDALVWPAPDGSPRLDVTVAATEFLGSATLVLFEPPGKPVRAAAENDPASGLWTARLDGYVPACIGDRMTFGVEIDSAYLFDPATGLALPHERAKVTVLA
jgi:multiple sugar transport system ATP-binding protein